jgi:hypothetical protein
MTMALPANALKALAADLLKVAMAMEMRSVGRLLIMLAFSSLQSTSLTTLKCFMMAFQ